MILLRHIAAAIAALLLLVSAAAADENITQFNSHVTVNADGSLTVRESITVNSEGREIRRGILRDFPTIYTTPRGTRVRVGFDVLSVKRDGSDETFAVESISNGKRVRIGNADVFLDDGLHRYDIIYRTTRQLGFFETFDELYWNVTGNGWTFRIDKASVTIDLPPGADISQHSVYTGRYGETQAYATVDEAAGRRFRAHTTTTLSAGEGFTVAVAWQKGIVAPPTDAEKAGYWLEDNLGYFGLGATFLAALLYYLFAWSRVGRDPQKGTIVPLFHPPDGLGPAGVRYVWRKGFDNKAFAAAVVGLAVKGRAEIFETAGDFRIVKKPNQGLPLTRSEAALYRSLPSGELELDKANNAAVRAARSGLSESLDDEYDGTMFLNNFAWFLIGLALSIAGLILSGFLMPEGEGAVAMFVGLFSSVWWGVVLVIAWATVKSLFGSGGIWTRIRSLMGLVFLIPFFGAGVAVPVGALFGSGMSPAFKFFLLAAAAVAGVNLLFYWLLKAPTPSGRKVMDQIEGFRMYMTTAEEERLKVLHPPEKTPELFERYMPYAMALDCENEWNDKFAAVLAAAAAAGAATGATVGHWYHGSGGGFGSRDFSDSLSHSMTSAISSASVAPGSSSGSGGGGFSGGGGGGGGGSGW